VANYIETYLKLAIRTAEKARGKCSPNPFVGAVIVKKDIVIATGYTQAYGSDHAEVNALKQAGKKAKGADMFVTLEPCSHYGKTPPCALAIIKAGIKRVFVGIIDPNPLVPGKGIAMMQEAGIEVQYGFLEDEIRSQLEFYLCYTQKQRPFITQKTALSWDGKYAAEDGNSRWITNESSRRYVHKLRSWHEVVLTGIKTILVDDPLLNVRLPGNTKQPVRAVLDPNLDIPMQSKFVATASIFPSLVFCSNKLLGTAKARLLSEIGVELCGLELIEELFDLRDVLSEIYRRKLYSVLLETGSGVAESFLKAGLVDKCLFFFGPLLIGGSKSTLSGLGIESIDKAITIKDFNLKKFGNTIMLSGYPVW